MNKLRAYAHGALIALSLSAGAASAAAPDFSGVWQVDGTIKELKTDAGQAPPLKPKAAKLYAANRAKLAKGDLSFDPTARCVAPGLPRFFYLPYPFEIIQRPKQVTYIFEWNYWNRRVDLTEKPRTVPYNLSLGVSKGKFEGDTLVIDTIGLRSDNTWLDAAGLPHSDELHVVERMQLLEGGAVIENRITFEDAQTFTKPWTTVVRFKRQPPGAQIKEDICLDRTDAGKPAVDWSRPVGGRAD